MIAQILNYTKNKITIWLVVNNPDWQTRDPGHSIFLPQSPIGVPKLNFKLYFLVISIIRIILRVWINLIVSRIIWSYWEELRAQNIHEKQPPVLQIHWKSFGDIAPTAVLPGAVILLVIWLWEIPTLWSGIEPSFCCDWPVNGGICCPPATCCGMICCVGNWGGRDPWGPSCVIW